MLLVPKIVYQAFASAPTTIEKTDLCLSETTFKGQYRNHVHHFKQWKYETSTGSLEYIWKLKDKGLLPTAKWKLLSKVNSTHRKGYCKLFNK